MPFVVFSMYLRLLNLSKLLEKRSHFLFGPRATGKSTLIAQGLPGAKVYDLLDGAVYQRLVRQPSIIEEETTPETTVVIDEIQKLPTLLDEVHRLIGKRKQTFLLTGSSARKLKRGGGNLLAGRAYRADLFPLTSPEIPDFDVLKYINTTGLPEFFGSSDARDFLDAYVGTYLQEEIHAESLTRNLAAFSRFLEIVALSNGEEVNLANIASDCGVATKTLRGYYEILNDTLLGFEVPAFQSTRKRKAISRSKYWLFDIGVVAALAQRGAVEIGSELFGKALEHFIALELRAYLSYFHKKMPLQYWRSTSQFEVDFIVGSKLAIEVKATDHVQTKHLKSLRALQDEGLIENYCVVSLDSNYRRTDSGIEIYPLAMFLKKLWTDSLL